MSNVIIHKLYFIMWFSFYVSLSSGFCHLSIADELCAVCIAESIFQVIHFFFFSSSTCIPLSFRLFLELEIGYMNVCVCVKVDKITYKTILSSIECAVIFFFL